MQSEVLPSGAVMRRTQALVKLPAAARSLVEASGATLNRVFWQKGARAGVGSSGAPRLQEFHAQGGPLCTSALVVNRSVWKVLSNTGAWVLLPAFHGRCSGGGGPLVGILGGSCDLNTAVVEPMCSGWVIARGCCFSLLAGVGEGVAGLLAPPGCLVGST